ncbi:MAG: hypothetical protein H6730_33535 [Deltaproteobacteria bacterium]|nr:hypothetical protein [Deltaproteobacteria bacterium]
MRALSRMGFFALAVGAATGCATTHAPDPLRGRCESDLGSDERCLHVLTRPDAGYESEQEVAAAEQARKAGAFQDRLARLRAEHEAREATRTSSVAVASDPEALEDPDEQDALLQLAMAGTDDPVDTGSSLRAMEAAPPPPPGPQVVTPTRAAPLQRTAPAALPVPAAAVAAPAAVATPEELLRAGRCLVDADRRQASSVLAQLKRTPGSSRAQQGALALVMMDGQGLMDRIDAEVAHRGLAKEGPVCSSSKLASVSQELRGVLGAPPASGVDAAQYGAGLERLVEVLQTRAGLPRAK